MNRAKRSRSNKKKQLYQQQQLSKNSISLENLAYSNIQDTFELELGDTQSLLNLLHELILQSYKIEKEFKDFKALIESVLEMIPQAVLVFNENGSLFYQNKKASRLNGLLDVDYSNMLETEVKIDNSIYLLQSSHVSHKQIITATNITEQKRQERLASMGQVSAHLAHEIRNPIGSLSLLAGVLSKRVDSDSIEIVNEMKKSIWRVERIIKSTLLFSKGVQANKQQHQFNDFKQSLRQVINEYGFTKEIDFSFTIQDRSFLVDFSLYEIALHNMLCNAIDAIEEGDCERGEVIIDFFQDNGMAICRIYDNGKDIDDINSLFEAFKTTKLKGHGLGLALSQQIALAHDGELCANNIEKKYFEIRIPL
ncbi:GHKL domain-containing protein [Helicobacter muridarum]|uniref:histidine kinase n=1 Tax=Helicobacter muridarum TaxID=216 RepID=A0A099U0T6_9HELI|nr:ATP-binding protein [Helicobacter muridarum]TLE00241.1 GHKL domain-containing protein [Helicobacter muridarum]STQ85733.1 putative histidine kinase sensor protein [Helicobacter muridarum]